MNLDKLTYGSNTTGLLGGVANFRLIFVRYLFNDVKPFGVLFLPGVVLFAWGLLYGGFLGCLRYFNLRHVSPSTGTVMFSIVPLFVGLQLLLSAFVLDVLRPPR